MSLEKASDLRTSYDGKERTLFGNLGNHRRWEALTKKGIRRLHCVKRPFMEGKEEKRVLSRKRERRERERMRIREL